MPVEAPLLAAIAFAGALIFGITGFGSALITIPLATHFVPLPFALALFAVVDLSCALTVGLENPKNEVRAEWTRYDLKEGLGHSDTYSVTYSRRF